MRLVDPYLYINDDNQIFAYGNTPIWTRFTIAKDFTVPELAPVSNYESISLYWVIVSGLNDFDINNLSVDSLSYVNYVNNFEGMILEYGEPEFNKIAIWHEPTKKFVSYYSP